MEGKTNLRALRHQYRISLPELSSVSGLSVQHISRAELRVISPTAQLEERLGAAVDAVITLRSDHLSALGRSFAACKGRLLQMEEGTADE